MKKNCIQNEIACFGCSVCFSICPVDAIYFKLNDDGFYEAFINEDACIECGKCLKACPKFEENYPVAPVFETLPVYAGWSKEHETVIRSTSGGFAHELSKWGIANGYKIAGVIYDYGQQKAKTVTASRCEQIEAFRNSKYLQSRPEEAFDEMLKSKDKFIVFGTPCQIAGLRLAADLSGERDRFILVDCFCHGVPSYLLWDSFLNWLKEKYSIEYPDYLNFRNKKNGWHSFLMHIRKNGKDHFLQKPDNHFLILFLADIVLNKPCYECRIRQEFAFADIRQGDYWGELFLHRDDGVSVLTANTPKGDEVINMLAGAGALEIMPTAHLPVKKEQIAFTKYKIYDKERQAALAALKNGARIKELYKILLKDKSLKFRFLFYVKNRLPRPLFKALRKIVRAVKKILRVKR